MANLKKFLAPALILFAMGAISGSIALGVAWASDQNDLGGTPVNITEGILKLNGPPLFSASGAVPGEIWGYDDDGQYIRFIWPELTGNLNVTWFTSLPAGNNYPLVSNATGQLSFYGTPLSSFPSGSGTDNHIVRWDGTGNIQDTGWVVNDADQMSLASAPDQAISITASSSSNRILMGQVTGDATNRILITAAGTMNWGPGSGSVDVVLQRLAADLLGLPFGDAFRITGDATDFSGTDEGTICYNTTDHMMRFYDGSSWVDMTGTGGGGMTSFTLSADSGSDQTISNANTLEVAGGTNGIDTSAGATDTVTINFDASEVGSVTWGTAATWTFPTSILFTTAILGLGNGSAGVCETRWYEDSDNGTNYFWVAAKNSLASTEGFYLPSDTPGDGEKLTWHTGGATSWDADPTLYYQTVRDEGTDETQRAALNFIGDNVEIADDSGNDETEVTIRDWQDHMSSIGHGLSAINATDVTAGTSNTSYCVYVGTAVKSYTTCTVNVQVTTAVATSITWAEVAICTGDWVPNGNPSLTTRGSTSVTGTYNSLGTKSTTISLSGINPGDDIWFVWGSQATTPFVLRAIQDDISNLGLTGSSAATRPSTMGAGTTFTRSSTNNPARVVVGL